MVKPPEQLQLRGATLPEQEASNCARRCVMLKVASFMLCCRCICLRKAPPPPAPRLHRKVLVIGPAGADKTALLNRMSIRDGAERLLEPRDDPAGPGKELTLGTLHW